MKYINKPFNRLPLKKRVAFILHLAGLTQREISRETKTSLRDVNLYIHECYKEYEEEMVTNLPYIEG